MKSQICLIREKYHNDLSRLSQLQKEKEDLVLFNQEIKGKLE
jgi:predicted nuclease with TOPRIM domain